MMLSVASWAQAPVYTCDFENATERAKWVLNPVARTDIKLANKWHIGAPGHFAPTGSHGLFISSDDGKTSDYTANTTMFVTAARDMSGIPAGDYNLYFNWQCKGKMGTGEGLYVCWVPDSVKINGATGIADLSPWVKDYLCADTILCNADYWRVGKASLRHDGKPRKLVFVWFCPRGKVVPPSACVDNIELRPVNQCAAPTKLSHTMSLDTVTITWKGNAAYYHIWCYNILKGTWQEQDRITGNSHTFTGVAEGPHTFIIRAFCNDDTPSDYVQYTSLIFHKGVRCIDYMDLGNNCWTGSVIDPMQKQGKVDYGFANLNSKHTLHYLYNEHDPLTNYELRTCPEGYLASVRLGNGGPLNALGGDGSGEAIEYRYTVQDKTSGILKIKYALVLQNPLDENHDKNGMPGFTLDVLRNGQPLDNDCGHVFFTAGDGSVWYNGAGQGGEMYIYKPWTEFSLNLRDYVGETLTIRLITTDCGPSGHTGYAYFVLDCESGEMTGLNCGEDNPTTEFRAPDGFDYEWYHADDDQTVLSRDQTYTLKDPLDTTTYNVRIINRKNHACYYTLSVTGDPRIPTPAAVYEAKEERCENVVTFRNLSYVSRQNMVTKRIEPTNEPVTSLTWDFGDGTVLQSLDSVVQHIYPKQGGNYTLRLAAGVSNDACVDTIEIPVNNLPDLRDDTTKIYEHLCEKDFPHGYPYMNRMFKTDIDTIYTFLAQSGCDSLCHLVLHFHGQGPFLQQDTMCNGEVIDFFGHRITQGGRYTDTLQNAFGCDSIVCLDLYEEPPLIVQVPETINVCSDSGIIDIPFLQTSGRLDSVTLSFDADACAAGFAPVYTFPAGMDILPVSSPRNLTPNLYRATLSYTTPLCAVPDQPVYVQICYPADIIMQRANVLLLKNADANGGYQFVEYQWYRDGEPVVGATMANLAVTEADLGHEFYVYVTREGETTPVRSCSIWYGTTPVDNVSLSELHGPVQVFTIVGACLGTMQQSEINNLSSGIYILTNGKKTAYIVR